MPCSVTMSVVFDREARTAGAGVIDGDVTVIDTAAECDAGTPKAAATPTTRPATVPATIEVQRRASA